MTRVFTAQTLRFSKQQLGSFPDIEFIQNSPIAFDLLGNSYIGIKVGKKKKNSVSYALSQFKDINGKQITSMEINSNCPRIIIPEEGRIFVDYQYFINDFKYVYNSISDFEYNIGLGIITENISDVYINDNFEINHEVNEMNTIELNGMENVYIKGDISKNIFRLIVGESVKKIVAPKSLLDKINYEYNDIGKTSIPRTCQIIQF